MTIAWIHGLGNVAALAVVAVNIFIRDDDIAGAVLPVGLTLSAATFVAVLITVWLGGEMRYRHGVGVSRNIGSG